MKFNFIKNQESNARSFSSAMTVNEFFTVEDGIGYMKKNTFIEMMSQMRDNARNLFNKYQLFFECVKDGMSLSEPVRKNTHQTNHFDYYYLKFKKGRVKVETMIYDVENIGKFIKDYADGIIKPDFTLDELLDEASN